MVILTHWLGAYRIYALYRGQIFVRFNDLWMCLRELCCRFGIFYCLDLNHLVRVFYIFMFSLWLSLENARCCFLGSKSTFSSANHRCLL